MVTRDDSVREIMSKVVTTLSANKTLSDALYWMNDKRIGSITIMENDKAVGIITRNDLRRYSDKDFTKIKLKNVMSKSVYYVTSDTSIKKTERIINRKKIGSILVIDNEEIKGIVTKFDLRTKITPEKVIQEIKEEKQPHDNYKPSSISQKLSEIIGNAVGFVFVLVIVAYFVISIIGLFTADCAYAISGFCLDWRNSPTGTAQNTVNDVYGIATGNTTIFTTNPIPTSEYNTLNKMYISQNVLREIEDDWSSNNQVEFRDCLYGSKYDDGYIIDKLTRPNTQFKTQYEVMAEDCPYNSIGTIHSHPIGDCLPSSSDNSADVSENDVKNLLNQNYPLMLIMCDPDKIVVYTKRQYTKSIDLILVKNDGSTSGITTTNPCRGDLYCDGKCWIGCGSGSTWTCTSKGGMCV